MRAIELRDELIHRGEFFALWPRFFATRENAQQEDFRLRQLLIQLRDDGGDASGDVGGLAGAAVVRADHHHDEFRRDAVHRAVLEPPDHVFRLVPAKAEVSGIPRRVKLTPGLLAAQRVAVELLAAEEMRDGVADEEDLRLRALHGGAGELVAFFPIILRPAPILRHGHHGARKRLLAGNRLKARAGDFAHRFAIW